MFAAGYFQKSENNPYVSLPLSYLFQTCNVSVGIFMASDDGDVCLCMLSHSFFSIPGALAQQVSSVHGISQARMLWQVDISYSRGSTHPGSNPHLLRWQADSLPLQPLVG